MNVCGRSTVRRGFYFYTMQYEGPLFAVKIDMNIYKLQSVSNYSKSNKLLICHLKNDKDAHIFHEKFSNREARGIMWNKVAELYAGIQMDQESFMKPDSLQSYEWSIDYLVPTVIIFYGPPNGIHQKKIKVKRISNKEYFYSMTPSTRSLNVSD